jgi:hypothetical protein
VRCVELEPRQNGRRGAGREDPEEGLDERLGLWLFLLFLSRLACSLLPEGDVLGQAGAKLLGVGRVSVDLDSATSALRRRDLLLRREIWSLLLTDRDVASMAPPFPKPLAPIRPRPERR